MTMKIRVLKAAALAALATGALSLGASQVAAQAGCAGAGVVTRITGDPAQLQIMRGSTRVARPRVLDVVCVGDRVSVAGATRATLSLDGRGTVQIAPGPAYAVAARQGAPTLAGNAYRAVNDQVMPDMRRLPWNVRLRGGEPFEFALVQLPEGSQQIAGGQRSLLVRVQGGQGPYRVTLASATGQQLAEVSGQGAVGEPAGLRLPSANLAPGRYRLTANDSSGGAVQAEITVADRAPTVPNTYQAISDPEVRAAATAAAIARANPDTRALEAVQLLAEAPANGLDRGAVYSLIESYGD